MKYAVYRRITFPCFEYLHVLPLDYLSLVLEDCRKQLQATGCTSNINTLIRPWPRDITESSKTGYDRLAPRIGLEVIVTGE